MAGSEPNSEPQVSCAKSSRRVIESTAEQRGAQTGSPQNPNQNLLGAGSPQRKPVTSAEKMGQTEK